MSAYINTVLYAWCSDCSDGTEVGISTEEANAWVKEHDALNHEEEVFA